MHRYQVAEEDIRRVRGQFTRAFTGHHQRLVDICTGRVKPPCVDQIRPLNLEQLELPDLMMLLDMVEVEFATSLAKEMKGTEEASGGQEPHPFDVFLMETTIDQRDSRLAVCMPTRTNDLVWYNGLDEIWRLEERQHKWRVASLSGTARVMEALCKNPDSHPLMAAAMKRELIVEAVDDDAPNDDMDPAVIQHLNESQRRAVRTVVSPSFSCGFFVIQGPPGTGKTTTSVAIISALVKQGVKVLVTAPSNAAVANIALKLWSSRRGDFSFDDIIVFGENCDKSVEFLNPRHRGVKFSMLPKKMDSMTRPAERDMTRRAFLTWLNLHEDDDRDLTDLTNLCPYIDTSTIDGRNYYAELLSQSGVVFSTLNSAGSMMLRDSFPARMILLDEGGQCPEAEFHIATTFPNVEKLCVIGDPRQLPSTVIEPRCKIAGYGKSWLENVFQIYPDKVHLLDTQYRMDQEILRFPNREFYEGRILSGSNVLSREPYVEKPFLFVDTSGRGHEEVFDFSWQNGYEVTVIKALLFNDPDIARVTRQSSRTSRVIIISPYKAQVKLLKKHITLAGVLVEIATVDSFQGQEGDIVVVSTVRTHRVGFVDDAQRLNVALTRSKRILRIVGDAAFFESIASRSSTLRNLTKFSRRNAVLETTAISRIPWSRPNWSQTTLWKPIMTQRFHYCLKKMPEREKNICLNTLFAIAQPNCSALYPIPLKSKPSWYMSCLREHKDRRIVWIAKRLGKRAVEAHFAGTYKECLRFSQAYPEVPEEACIVSPGLTSLTYQQEDYDGYVGRPGLCASWRVTNTTQNLVFAGGELPVGSVQLDSFQENVARSSPPLIIESRSGTGKTLVLLQHAAYHSDLHDERPACFMTVSHRLRNELEQRYRAINQAENLRLPDTIFVTFDMLVRDLLRVRRISDLKNKAVCTYIGFEASKKSHERTQVEPHLVENEIGGVINGSLLAAQQSSPLSRLQYLQDKRSNIGYDTEADLALRNQVYDEFEKYVAWKLATGKYDVGDVVLRLLKEEWEQHFASAYLDECQDLSYATIFLICQIAGKDSLRWVCAGDPAQMISPGCSFTFDGLKQTFLAVENGIESKLSKVSHLHVNYRTTKAVLHLANEVLAVARKEFPGSIPYAQAEIAKKDLGLKVVLCEWTAAMKLEVRLGTNQAVVYSSPDPKSLVRELTDWIGEHPYTISSLQAKGLEFDDVIVAFDHDRKTWNLSDRSEASLCMLRELYVAITRAQRRVIVLVKKALPEMQRFYAKLKCDFQVEGAELVLKSMDTVATAEQWLDEAKAFFDDQNYEMATRCFGLAGVQGWMHWSRGKDLEAKGIGGKAADQFLLALESFAIENDYQQVLEVSLVLSSPAIAAVSQWQKKHDDIVEEALQRLPNHLKRFDVVRLALMRSLWNQVSVHDMKDQNLASLFLVYRKSEYLKALIKSATDSERTEIEAVLPVVIGDYHSDGGGYARAVRIFLSIKNSFDAEDTTKTAIRDAGMRPKELVGVVECWKRESREPRDGRVSLLIELFRSPSGVLVASHGKDSMRLLGRSAVLLAIDKAKEDPIILYDFSSTDFRTEVTEALVTRFEGEPIRVVHWFLGRNDNELALAFVQRRLKDWKDVDIIFFMQTFYCDMPPWLQQTSKRRNLLPLSIALILGSSSLTISNKNSFMRELCKVDHQFQLGKSRLAITAAWAVNEIVTMSADGARKRRTKGKKEATHKHAAPSNVRGSHMEVLARQILYLWPARTKAAKRSTLAEERITPDLCHVLLDFVQENSSPEDVQSLVSCLGTHDTVTKAIIPVITICMKQDDGTVAKALTMRALQSSKVPEHELLSAISLWADNGDTKSVCGVLIRALLTTPKKDKGIMVDKFASLVELALRRKRVDLAWAVTVACTPCAKIRLPAVLAVLKAWDSHHWICEDRKGRTMFQNSESVLSFLRLVLGTFNSTDACTTDCHAQVVYVEPGDEYNCCWLSQLVVSFGPALIGFAKLYPWNCTKKQAGVWDRCSVGQMAYNAELRKAIRHRSSPPTYPRAKRDSKPLSLEEKMAKALVQGKTFTPAAGGTTRQASFHTVGRQVPSSNMTNSGRQRLYGSNRPPSSASLWNLSDSGLDTLTKPAEPVLEMVDCIADTGDMKKVSSNHEPETMTTDTQQSNQNHNKEQQQQKKKTNKNRKKNKRK